ncbi:hypothetical protein C1T31_08700 [Hanstruepera neustonica]|uniref:Secretion system C-terminal sorting domain-containing protein n=1 Tax=Hanstruepera neustonica TaxID=1445657 RepID=A0A2K1DYG8_9FLAO|nr:T9SS type A sorting domain-containing protein [Hanstruepera neustonica]PNQ73063.1 hypothetical protein C1T31_08700 [Hanstruepera neustonica]
MASTKSTINFRVIVTFCAIVIWCLKTSAQTTSIPDSSFEQALIDYGVDTNGLNGNILNSDAESVITLNIFNKNIIDLTGIEAFINLKYLYCYFNNVQELNLQSNLQLEVLDIENNSLTNLDISANTELKELYISNNLLSNLDVSNNLDLEVLSCNLNNLSDLDVDNNMNLSVLWCYSNNLQNINLQQNILLESLFCGDNNLSSLNIASNPLLQTISCSQNNLSELIFDNCQDLSYLDVSGNNFSQIDVSSNSSLTRFLCNNNNFQSLDVSQNPELMLFYASFNGIREIDLTNNNDLKYVRLENNELESIDIRNGQNSSISDFNANNNPALTCVYVDNTNANYLANWDIDSSANFVQDEAECNALSTQDVKLNDMVFEMYPNPVIDYMNITVTDTKSTLRLYTLKGQSVFQSKLSLGTNSIDLSNYSTGFYLVEITTSNQKVIKKIIKS